MVFFTDEDKNFIKKHLPNADKVLSMSNVRDVLHSVSDWIDTNGFAPPDYYDYNDLGRVAQQVYDRIYLNN